MPPSGAPNSRRRPSGWNARPSPTRQAAEQLPASQVPDPQQFAPAPQAVVGHQQLAVRAEGRIGIPEIAPVRPRQADQLAVVVQPAHDHRAGPLHDRVPLQGGIDADAEDVATVVLPAHAEVGQTQGGDGMVADLGQSLPALGVGAQDLRGLAEPVQAVEPLADQPGALERRPLGDQRLAQRQPGLVLGMLGPGEARLGPALLEPKLVASAHSMSTPPRSSRSR